MAHNIHSQKIKIGDMDVHYLTGGQGEPLLVVHGGGGEGARAWLNNAAALAENYTVYIPYLPGFGETQPLQGDYFIPEMVDFVDRFAHSLRLDRFHLLGHSLGGGIALSYALRFPQNITKLVLVNSFCLGKEVALWMRFLANPKTGRYLGGVALAVLKAVKWLVGTLMLAPFEFVVPFTATSVYLGCCMTNLKEQTTVFMHRLTELVMPTLVVWGAKDPIVPFRQAYAAAQLIPYCQVKVFADSGHSVYREKLQEFTQLLRGFLD